MASDVLEFRLTKKQLHKFLLVTWPVYRQCPNGRVEADVQYNHDNQRWYDLAFVRGHVHEWAKGQEE